MGDTGNLWDIEPTAYLPAWPAWAVRLLYAMAVVLVVTLVFARIAGFGSSESELPDDVNKLEGNGDAAKEHQSQLRSQFNSFRRKYISVYLIIMLADWMQGTHMYTLYLSYGVNVSALFLTGFLSGAIFAPFLGSAVDKFGRKRSCIFYCLLEIVINTLEHYDNMPVLLVGRVLGGISTNLLFSAFESWMTTEHRRQHFPEKWLSQTYADASIGNGSMAILAGIVAQLLEDSFGHIGPFQGAIALTGLALVLIMVQFDENYGEKGNEHHEHGGSHTSLYKQFLDGWKKTCQDSHVYKIGFVQALSEGAMYTFVFMWVPTLLSLDPPDGLPTGCVFASFMMAITIGGTLFPTLQAIVQRYFSPADYEAEFTATLTYGLASASMAVPAWCLSSFSGGGSGAHCFENVLASFVVVEMCVGLFMPVAGTLRSKYVPDSLQGAILNIFRLPLNVVVVLGTRATDVMEPYKVFLLVSGCFFGATLIQGSMIGASTKTAAKTTKSGKLD